MVGLGQVGPMRGEREATGSGGRTILVLCLPELAEQILPSSGWEQGEGIMPATRGILVHLLNGSVSSWTPLLAFTAGLKLMS